MITITLPDTNDFVISVTLDSVPFKLHLSWNDRAGHWTLGILDDSGAPILVGIRCVPNYPLLAQYRRPSLPKGELICTVLSDSLAKIGRNDFVTGKAKLVYVTEAELNGTI